MLDHLLWHRSSLLYARCRQLSPQNAVLYAIHLLIRGAKGDQGEKGDQGLQGAKDGLAQAFW